MGSADVTRRQLVLGSRDSTTGWRIPDYTETTIECLEYSRGAHTSLQGVGFYAAEDKMFLTADPVNEYDMLEPRTSEYFLVKTVKEHFAPTPDNFFCRELQCSALPLWQAAFASATWKTSPNDPRERTKTFLDTYVRDAQITKDDGSTEASWACIFINPPYPLELEFRGASEVQGLYVVGQPTTESRLGVRYTEHVPVSIYTVDSTACAGDPLSWKMEAEWRYVIENYPMGSLRDLETRRGEIIDLGSTQLYHIPTVLNYTRTSERGKA